VDGKYVDGAAANKPRPDVAEHFPEWGDRRGFWLTVPAAPGSRLVQVYGIDTNGQQHSQLGDDHRVRVSAPPPKYPNFPGMNQAQTKQVVSWMGEVFDLKPS
jgi:hypothetical protein